MHLASTYNGKHVNAWPLHGTRLLTASDNGEIFMWGHAPDSTSTTLIQYRLAGHSTSASVKSLRFSPGGEFIAAASSDGTVRLWEAHDLTAPPRVFLEHTGNGAATMVAFVWDDVLVSSAEGGTVYIRPTVSPSITQCLVEYVGCNQIF